MTPARWRQIESLYDQALEIDPPRRVEFLDEACGGDVDLRRALERLVSEKPQQGSFLEKPAIKEIAEEFAATIGSSWVGVQIGNYQLVSLAGAGGMGEVYRARDTKLKRDVAIKILPDEFSRDPDRVSRFQREAELLASLNHPNIAAIYDLEEADSHRFLILELVEGETLADRIQRGPIPAGEALRIALQIAEALEAAHEKSVIHRDLKPANVKVTAGGKVKVLDFGLAKALLGDAGVNLSNSPTVSMAATQQGVILGTAAYMSPEQARGQAVDRRADVWAFGCVLFEMLSGRPTFGGKTLTDVIASVLKTAPDWNSLPANLHPRILYLLERCLEKEPKDRSQGLADARFEINNVLANPGSGLTVRPIQARAGLRSTLPWIAAIVVAAVVAAILGLTFKSPEPARVEKQAFVLPEGQILGDKVSMMSISRDGRIAYASGGGLYLKNVDELESRPIPGSEGQGASQPEFSPDGQWLAFTTGSPDNSFFSLKKIPVVGGTPVPLIENSRSGILGLSWTENDTILFRSVSIMEIPASGGIPRVLIEGGGTSNPKLLPGGTSLMFSVTTTPGSVDSAKIVVQDLRSGSRKDVWQGTDARYITTGHIVYMQGNTLFTIPFDLDRLKIVGVPVPVIEGVRRATSSRATGHYDVSDNGTLVYIPGGPISPRLNLLALVDRNGVRQMLGLPPQQYRSPRFSPDQTQVSVEVTAEDGKHNIWIYSLTGAFDPRQLTQTGHNTQAIWTHDSKSVTFASDNDGLSRIYSRRADLSAGPEHLTTGEPGIQQLPESWSRDELTLSFVKDRPGDSSLWTLSMETGRSRLLHDDKGFDDFGSAFSPDGKWLAYTVTAGPAPGIRVQPFPPTGQIHKLTEKGESWPVWSQDNELFFRTNEGELIGMDISTKGRFGFGNKRPIPVGAVNMTSREFRDYDVTRDGGKFVMIVPAKASVPAAASAPAPRPRSQINVVNNWFEELKTLVLPRQ